MEKQYRSYLKRRVNRRNIVECYMLRPFGHPVACCCLLLGSRKLSSIADSKFENNFSHSEIVWLKKFDKKVQIFLMRPILS